MPSNTTALTKYATLVLICKRPALHYGKQRLAKTLGAARALTFAQYFLACALEDLSDWPGEVAISPSHQRDVIWAEQLLSRETMVIAQSDGNLGERLNVLDQQLRDLGHQQLIFIGSDAPILAMDDYTQVNHALTGHAIALCPARDGGVTIMANDQAWPALQTLPWSSAQLGAELASLCRRQGLSVTHTPMRYDVDSELELLSLVPDLTQDTRPARQALAKAINQLI